MQLHIFQRKGLFPRALLCEVDQFCENSLLVDLFATVASSFAECLQAIHLALKQAGAAPETTLYLDDSARNISAAHDEGIYSVLVSRF